MLLDYMGECNLEGRRTDQNERSKEHSKEQNERSNERSNKRTSASWKSNPELP
jgi:hypothetical protein